MQMHMTWSIRTDIRYFLEMRRKRKEGRRCTGNIAYLKRNSEGGVGSGTSREHKRITISMTFINKNEEIECISGHLKVLLRSLESFTDPPYVFHRHLRVNLAYSYRAGRRIQRF